MDETLPKPQNESRIRQNIFANTIILILSSLMCGGIYWYVFYAPHCQFLGDGSYSCDIFASKTEKQNMCVQDMLMNSQNMGTTGYNVDTGKTYILSKADLKAEYDTMVEVCKS